MPGFDRSGPTGMGPMTGGSRGLCNSREGNPILRNFGSAFRSERGGARGNRELFGAPGRFRRGRFSPMGFRKRSFFAPNGRDQEIEFLKDQTTVLRQELEATDRRLKDLESGERAT